MAGKRHEASFRGTAKDQIDVDQSNILLCETSDSTREMARKGSEHTIVMESHDIQAYDGLDRNWYDNLVASPVCRAQSGVFATLLDNCDNLVDGSG